MTLDRQLPAAAERRPLARTIPTMMPARIMTPSRTHSEIRSDPLLDAGELVTVGVGVLPVVDGALVGVEGALVGVAVTLGLGETLGLGLGDELSLGPAETLAVRLDKALDIELWVLSHPATMHPRARIAAKRTRPLVKRRMPILPRVRF